MQTLLLAAMVWAQAADFRAEKSLTRIGVRASDAAGKPITGLQSKDFTIEENGLRLPAESVSQEEVPLDLALLLDVSHSMSGSLRYLASTGRDALQSLKPGDRMAVFTFAGDVRLELPLTDHIQQIDACLEMISLSRSRPATALYAPVFRAADYLRTASDRGRRRAVLMVSDAEGYKAKSEKETLHALWEADASLYLLRTSAPKYVRALRYSSPAGFLPAANVAALVDKSGGETLQLRKEGFGEMLRRIRAQYTVYYSPPAGESKRKATVNLSEEAKKSMPGAKALGRKEYTLAP